MPRAWHQSTPASSPRCVAHRTVPHMHISCSRLAASASPWRPPPRLLACASLRLCLGAHPRLTVLPQHRSPHPCPRTRSLGLILCPRTHALGLTPRPRPHSGVLCPALALQAGGDSMEEVVLQVVLEPQSPAVIVPSLGAPGSEAPYELRIMSGVPLELVPLPEVMPRAHARAGRWRASAARAALMILSSLVMCTRQAMRWRARARGGRASSSHCRPSQNGRPH